MRLFFLLSALLLHSVAASAQTTPVPRLADSLALRPPEPAPTDSAAALRRMFAAKRSNRTLVVLGTALAGGFSLAISGIFSSDKQSPLSQTASQSRVVGLTVLAGVGELIYYSQYSPEKEKLALLGLELHKLSPELKRELKPKYFLPATRAQAQAGSLPAALPANLPTPTPSVVAQPAIDTAAALHQLFTQQRHKGHVGLRAGAGILVVSGIALAIGTQGGYSGLGASIAGVLGAVTSVPVLTRGFVLTVGHGKRREQRVLQAWQQHRLPKRWTRRALVPDYTQPPK